MEKSSLRAATPPPSAPSAFTDLARENGWSVEEYRGCVTFTRGDVRIMIEWNAVGQLTFLARDERPVHRGKSAKLREWLTARPEADAGMQRVEAPWRLPEVDSANAYQHSGVAHPFTCNVDECRAASAQEPLVATEAGWRCRRCGRTQSWAWRFMLTWAWRRQPGLYALAVLQTRRDS